jgi:aminoglycoside phosphotransferase (APT) family kinase protein
MADLSQPSPPGACLTHFAATPVQFLGGRRNQHWLVKTPHGQFVLREFADDTLASADYECKLLRLLHEREWPVPVRVGAPLEHHGQVWCLFTQRPGMPLAGKDALSQRARGRLLAQLHEATSALTGLGQRPDFMQADEMLNDASLLAAVTRYERQDAEAGHVMRWHLDKARALIADIDVTHLSRIILHGDFAPWNLLYDGGALTGVIDFEAAHLNCRVSDFALSWRGSQDDVIDGYEENHALSDVDRQMIVPAFWAWLFRGVREEIEAAEQDATAAADFKWQIRHFLLRSRFNTVERYPRFSE